MIFGVTLMFIISILSFIISVRSFMEKGFVFNNAYIYASKKEREEMNKKPYYRQSGIAFLLVGTMFLLNGFNIIFNNKILFYIVIFILIFIIIYAIVSNIAVEKGDK